MILSDETRSILIKLIPFILSIIIYFCGFIPHNDRVLLAFTKCLPILCLITFIGMYSMDIKTEYYDSSVSWYVKLICLGLFFSGVGDALLVWPFTFQLCIIMFTIAHIHYMVAFGFQPRGWMLGVFAYCLASAIVLFLSSGTLGLNMYLVPMYTFTALTTIWRSTASFCDKKYWTCIRWTTVFGSILLGLSHFIIGVEKFKMHLIYISDFDMIFYYAAQLLITLSIMEPQFQSSNSCPKLI